MEVDEDPADSKKDGVDDTNVEVILSLEEIILYTFLAEKYNFQFQP